MSVLVEGITIVVPISRINDCLTNGILSFEKLVPNKTFRADDYIVAASFMHPQDAHTFSYRLQQTNLCLENNGQFCDIAVVDQLRGLTAPCSWLNFTKTETVSYCWLINTEPGNVMVPVGWKYDKSLSKNYGYILPNDIQETRGGARNVDVVTTKSGAKGYIGRTHQENDHINKARASYKAMRKIYKNTKIRFSDFINVGKYFPDSEVSVRPRDAYEITKWISETLRFRRGGLIRARMPKITCEELHTDFLEANPHLPHEAAFLSFFYFSPETLRRLGFCVDPDSTIIDLWDE